MMDTQTPANVAKEVDPSVLTTQQLWREIASLKELMLSKIASIDKSIDTAHQNEVRRPTEIDRIVLEVKTFQDEKFRSVFRQHEERIIFSDRLNDSTALLIIEKFSGVEKQFRERDVRGEQSSKDTKVAVDAALQAAEKARTSSNDSFALSIAKSEAATMKQIDQQGAFIGNVNTTLDSKINDLKERLTRIEGMSTGKKDFWGYIVGAIGLIATLITIFVYLTRK